MKPNKGFYINHINGNGLDNRRENLEIVTPSVNARKSKLRHSKTSIYRGVSKFRDKFAAELTIDYRCHKLGLFISEIEAAKAYNEAVLKFLGPGFPLNET